MQRIRESSIRQLFWPRRSVNLYPLLNPLRIILTHCLTAAGKQCLNSAQTGACKDNPMIAAWVRNKVT